MKIAKESDRERILQYLEENIEDCLYLYMDIINYGIASENMTVWYLEEKGKLSLVAMKYYDSYQIYCHEKDKDLGEVCHLLRENPATMISGRKDIIERLSGKLEDYQATYGCVFREKAREGALEEVKTTFHIMRAREEDLPEVARLLCMDRGFGTQYKEEVLTAQLAERIRTGTGRSYIVRAGETNEVIAHMGTFAEVDRIAILSGSVVMPQYRKSDVYMELGNYIGYELGREQKISYFFTTSKKMIYVYKHICIECGEYGKLVKSGGI